MGGAMLDDQSLRGLLTGETSDIDGVSIGSSDAEVRSGLGEPDQADHGWWRYPGLSVKLTDGRVEALRFSVAGIATRLNIASEQDLVALTGNPASRLGCRDRVTLAFPDRDRSVSVTLAPFAVEAVVLHAHDLVAPSPAEWSFADGYRATLDVVEMGRVYGGLLEGLPTEKMNDRAIRGYVEAAQQRFGGTSVHLVEPSRTPIDSNGRYAFGKPERLPPVACTARFGSRSCARDMSMDGSALVVVWFQETMEFPGDRARFASVCWRELAKDVEW
jgi:hypothetical protein